MKISVRFINTFLSVALLKRGVDAFSIGPETSGKRSSITTTKTTSESSSSSKLPWPDVIGKAVCSGLVAASIWAAPVSVPLFDMQQPVAVAKEMASASGSRVNKDADSLLRYGLPIKNKEVSLAKTKHRRVTMLFDYLHELTLVPFDDDRFANCKPLWKRFGWIFK